LLSCLIRPLASTDWWEKILVLIGSMAREIPCYQMEFDRSGNIVVALKDLPVEFQAEKQASPYERG
jgi:hypothetical protein